MLTYELGGTLTHQLDPQTKLAVQVALTAAGFAHTTSTGSVALGIVAAGCFHAADASPVSALHDLRRMIPLLALDSVVEAARPGAPWLDLKAAVEPALVSVHMLLVFFVAAAYVRTTPICESRATIRLLMPGQSGIALGVDVALVLWFLPLVRYDLHCVREAQAVRLGGERQLNKRLLFVAAAGLRRSFVRADALTLTLRARYFARSPTLPEIRFGRRNVPGPVLVAALLISLAL